MWRWRTRRASEICSATSNVDADKRRFGCDDLRLGGAATVQRATRFEEGWFRGAFSPVAKPIGPPVNARPREIGRWAFRDLGHLPATPRFRAHTSARTRTTF